MWLYHGTYSQYYKTIKKQGLILPDANKDTVTQELDTLINNRAGRKLRGGCVYLSNDKDTMMGFDEYFRISTSWIDTRLLYVANNRELDEILCRRSEEDMAKHIDGYIKSYISYENYLNVQEKYDRVYSPEFLYYAPIVIYRGKPYSLPKSNQFDIKVGK